jgi:hypothetical protein
MKPIKNLVITVVFLICSLTTFSQSFTEEESAPLENGTIENQFEYIIEKSGNFKGTNGLPYEAIKLSMLLNLRTNIADSLKTLKKDVAESKILIDNQTKEIADLKLSLDNTKKSLENAKTENETIGLFGIPMSKAIYKAVMWFIIVTLLALLAYFIYKFKNSNTITREAKKSLLDIEEEFEEHRKTAVEREQKVRRQLQDEINKQKTTKGNK